MNKLSVYHGELTDGSCFLYKQVVESFFLEGNYAHHYITNARSIFLDTYTQN
jgi:hypothetical protein